MLVSLGEFYDAKSFDLEIIYCFNIFVFQHLGSSLAVLSRNKSNILYIEGLILFINSRTLYTILRSWLHQCACVPVCVQMHIKTWFPQCCLQVFCFVLSSLWCCRGRFKRNLCQASCIVSLSVIQ